MRSSVVLFSVCVAGTVWAGAPKAAPKAAAKLVDGAKANPPRFIDESQTYLALGSAGPGYSLHLHAQASNVPADAESNKYQLVVKQGGKVITTVDCGYHADIDCVTKDHEELKAKGPIEAQLTFYDDSDKTTYLLRTFKADVVHFTSFGDAVWQIRADDVLGEGWLAGMKDAGTFEFRFWLADENPESFDVACTVDGKTKVPAFRIGADTSDPQIQADVVAKGSGNHTKYVWRYQGADTSPEVKTGLPPKGFKSVADHLSYVGEYPGNWDCDLQLEGGNKVVRKFMFHVNDKGTVDPNPDLAGELFVPDVVPVDMRFGKDAIDVRVRPDAIKKSAPFGRPWPKGPPKNLPKASGLADPK